MRDFVLPVRAAACGGSRWPGRVPAILAEAPLSTMSHNVLSAEAEGPTKGLGAWPKGLAKRPPKWKYARPPRPTAARYGPGPPVGHGLSLRTERRAVAGQGSGLVLKRGAERTCEREL